MGNFCRVQQLQELEQRLAQLAAKLDQQLLVAKCSGLARKPEDEGALTNAPAEEVVVGAGGAGVRGTTRISSRRSSSSWLTGRGEGNLAREVAGGQGGEGMQQQGEGQAQSREVSEQQQEQPEQSPQGAGVLLQVLQAMEQLELEEREVRSRWFDNGRSSISAEVRRLAVIAITLHDMPWQEMP